MLATSAALPMGALAAFAQRRFPEAATRKGSCRPAAAVGSRTCRQWARVHCWREGSFGSSCRNGRPIRVAARVQMRELSAHMRVSHVQ